MNFIEIMMAKAVETVDQISDPAERAFAIAEFLKTPFANTDVEIKAAPKAEEKAAKAAKPAKAKKVEAKEETKTETKAEVKEEAKTAEPAVKAEPVPEPEPVAEAPVVAEPAPETVEKVKEAVEKVEPYMAKDKELPAERQKRHEVLVKAYGDLTLKQVLSDKDKKVYFSAELEAIRRFRDFMIKKFGTGDAGNKLAANQLTAPEIEATIHHYIHECSDKTSENWNDITIDKFISKFMPYMMSLYKMLAKYSDEQIFKAGCEMCHSSVFGLNRINLQNIDALHYLLNPEEKIG